MAKKVNEQNIDYGGYRERMDPKLERRLDDPEKNLYGNNPAMGQGTGDVERLATARFKKVTDKLKQVTGIEDLSSERVQRMIVMDMYRDFPLIKSIENQHKEELQNLAVQAAVMVTEMPPDRFEIEPDLKTNFGQVDVTGMRSRPEEDDDEPDDDYGDFDAERLTKREEFELEKHKRNIINGIIQGAGKRGHFVFQTPEIKEQLDEIDPRLYPHYVKIMAINDFLYFTMDDMIEAASENGQGAEGRSEVVELDNGETKIKATGSLFPILVHELIKGFEETIGKHGLPEDPDVAKKVIGQTDTFSNEPQQLRIGPEILDKIRSLLPDEAYDEENYGVKPFFYSLLYKIPATEFLEIIKNTVSENERDNARAKQKFNQLYSRAKVLKTEYEQDRE